MTSATKTYNGWTNYETWNVKLWMDNNQADAEYWQEQARVCAADDADDPDDELAEILKERYEEAMWDMLRAANQSSSMWADLMGAALSEVNWAEIAESLLADLKEARS